MQSSSLLSPGTAARAARSFVRLVATGQFSELRRVITAKLNGGSGLPAEPDRPAVSDADAARLADYQKAISGLSSQVGRLDIEYGEMAKQFDDRYSLSCYRRDATEPYYKYIEVRQNMTLWRNRSLIDYIQNRSSFDPPDHERMTPETRATFASSPIRSTFERHNPARYQPGATVTLTDEHIDAILAAIGPQGQGLTAWQRFFTERTSFHGQRNDPIVPMLSARARPGVDVLCYGSIIPYIECLCLQKGANPVTMSSLLRYTTGRIQSLDPAMAEQSGKRFDVIVASLAIGRSALGLFSDRVDSDGDVAALSLLRRLLRPDGRLLVTVYTGPAALLYNAQRIYDEAGLARLFKGWRILEESRREAPMFPIPAPEDKKIPGYHALLAGFMLAPEVA